MTDITYSDIRQARNNAEETFRMADHAAREAAKLCAGRLRVSKVDASTLIALKRELKRFNATTFEWRD